MKRIAGFVITLGLLAAPLPTATQQPRKVYRIGWLQPAALPAPWVDGFRQGLGELGYIEGKDFVIEYRWAEGRLDRLGELATELVRLKADVIVSTNTAALRAIKQVTTTIPVVMLGPGDPIVTGIVASLARPGGNITGVTQMAPELAGKRLELLKEIQPRLSRVAVLLNSANPISMVQMRETEVAARALGVSLQRLDVRARDELEIAFSALPRGRADGLVLLADSMHHAQRRQIIDLAAKRRLPAISAYREFAEDGGLASYGPNWPDLHRRAATFVHKILKGAKPADLPVEQPMRFELVINMKTAKALGLTFPPSIMVRADHLIQ